MERFFLFRLLLSLDLAGASVSYMTERIGDPKPGVGVRAPPGDPTLSGDAPFPGTQHLSWEQIDHSDIPEIDVTQAVAHTLLARMTGVVVPQDWHGGFEMVEHVGGNPKSASCC